MADPSVKSIPVSSTRKEKLMFTHISRCLVAVSFLSIAVTHPARAQWAVVDAPATLQLIQEVQTTGQQLQTARAQLTQAQQALQTMTGDRGMELLLSGVVRNYLPTNSSQLASVMQGTGGGYPGLASDIRNAIGANAVLSPQALSTLPVANQQQIIAVRQSNALQQAIAQEALTNASDRFASIQSLVAAISTAGDQKAILDLQARIAAELGMLQNEQTKLQILHQATQAQDAVNRQQERELIIAGHGRFESRFQPVP
jgi:type IV secretion system protein VirB5